MTARLWLWFAAATIWGGAIGGALVNRDWFVVGLGVLMLLFIAKWISEEDAK